MFTSLFNAPAIFWSGLFALAVVLPILVHLINRIRYRRVQWAPMSFLLKGYRRRKRTIWLRQLLLILMRICLLVLAIFLFARIQPSGKSGLENSGPGRHVLIIDDSASMAQTCRNRAGANQGPDVPGAPAVAPGRTAYDQCRLAILELAERLSAVPNQTLVLVRMSEPQGESFGTEVPCDSRAEEKIQRYFAEHPVTHLRMSPLDWLAKHGDRIPSGDRVWLLSDFRSADLADLQTSDTTEITAVEDLKKRSTGLRFIRCVTDPPIQGHLGIEAFHPETGMLAAGVPFFVKLKIRNHSRFPVQNTEVQIRRGPALASGMTPEFEDEPGVLIPTVPAGESVEVQVPMLFQTAGQYLLEAELPKDEFIPDNRRQVLIDVPIANRVLLIGDVSNPTLRYLQWMFEPRFQGSTQVNSGFQTETRSAREVAEVGLDLAPFDVIFLLDDAVGDSTLVSRLEARVRNGALLFFIPGKFADPALINRYLHENGSGLLSFALDSEIDVPPRSDGIRSDVNLTASFLSRLIDEKTESLLGSMQVFRKLIPPRDWEQRFGTSTRVLATVRGRATTPLLLESEFGDGKVVTLLTNFDPQWSTLATNPATLVIIYRMIFHLRSFLNRGEVIMGTDFGIERAGQESQGVGESLRIDFSTGLKSGLVLLTGNRTDSGSGRCLLSGIYRIQRGDEKKWFTASVDAEESQLEVADELSIRSLGLSGESILSWQDLTGIFQDTSHWLDFPLLLMLTICLIVEQLLGLFLGFHRPESRRQEAS